MAGNSHIQKVQGGAMVHFAPDKTTLDAYSPLQTNSDGGAWFSVTMDDYRLYVFDGSIWIPAKASASSTPGGVDFAKEGGAANFPGSYMTISNKHLQNTNITPYIAPFDTVITYGVFTNKDDDVSGGVRFYVNGVFDSEWLFATGSGSTTDSTGTLSVSLTTGDELSIRLYDDNVTNQPKNSVVLIY